MFVKKRINDAFWADGTYYYKDPEYTTLHREDGPAIEYAKGTKEWFLNEVRHRENGPAVIWTKGNKFYFLNNKYFTKEHFIEHIKSKSLCQAKKSRILKQCTKK